MAIGNKGPEQAPIYHLPSSTGPNSLPSYRGQVDVQEDSYSKQVSFGGSFQAGGVIIPVRRRDLDGKILPSDKLALTAGEIVGRLNFTREGSDTKINFSNVLFPGQQRSEEVGGKMVVSTMHPRIMGPVVVGFPAMTLVDGGNLAAQDNRLSFNLIAGVRVGAFDRVGADGTPVSNGALFLASGQLGLVSAHETAVANISSIVSQNGPALVAIMGPDGAPESMVAFSAAPGPLDLAVFKEDRVHQLAAGFNFGIASSVFALPGRREDFGSRQLMGLVYADANLVVTSRESHRTMQITGQQISVEQLGSQTFQLGYA